MTRAPIRRAHLIAPFGVGAITVAPDGTAIITAGLDRWFASAETDDPRDALDVEEFKVEEWRLQEVLRVDHFRLPPDHRRARTYVPGLRNLNLTIPCFRFPQWNTCPKCKQLSHLGLHHDGRQRCEACKQAGTSAPLITQVPFIAMCEYGHLQDFPWREWVHQTASPACNQPMKLRATGGATLAAQSVECGCGQKRTLSGITEASMQGGPPDARMTYLSRNLARNEGPYLCQGTMPWHGPNVQGPCNLPLRGSLRSAANVYYALTRNAIYLPQGDEDIPAALRDLLSNPPLSTLVTAIPGLTGEPATPTRLRRVPGGELLQPFTDAQIQQALDAGSTAAASLASGEAGQRASSGDGAEVEAGSMAEQAFRQPELRALRTPQQRQELRVRSSPMDRYDSLAATFLGRIMLIDQLRETRALSGFRRVFPEGEGGLRDRKALLWAHQQDHQSTWLPAYIVHGEGILLELRADRLARWEAHPGVQDRAARLQSLYDQARQTRRLHERTLTARFILLHTFAHLLLNQLTYECGYSSAALRERLYVTDDGDTATAAVLIYTAAGDAEGTMGGLVRMGKPGNLEPVLEGALAQAGWCAADPVCMETSRSGQGPDSCNLAACHNCALIPETACEEFNRFLDRALAIGTHDEPGLGYFAAGDTELGSR